MSLRELQSRLAPLPPVTSIMPHDHTEAIYDPTSDNGRDDIIFLDGNDTANTHNTININDANNTKGRADANNRIVIDDDSDDDIIPARTQKSRPALATLMGTGKKPPGRPRVLDVKWSSPSPSSSTSWGPLLGKTVFSFRPARNGRYNFLPTLTSLNI